MRRHTVYGRLRARPPEQSHLRGCTWKVRERGVPTLALKGVAALSSYRGREFLGRDVAEQMLRYGEEQRAEFKPADGLQSRDAREALNLESRHCLRREGVGPFKATLKDAIAAILPSATTAPRILGQAGQDLEFEMRPMAMAPSSRRTSIRWSWRRDGFSPASITFSATRPASRAACSASSVGRTLRRLRPFAQRRDRAPPRRPRDLSKHAAARGDACRLSIGRLARLPLERQSLGPPPGGSIPGTSNQTSGPSGPDGSMMKRAGPFGRIDAVMRLPTSKIWLRGARFSIGFASGSS